MIAHKIEGRIVNIASIAGQRAIGQLSTYGMSKAGMIQMTHQMAREWSRHGINTNAICPGSVYQTRRFLLPWLATHGAANGVTPMIVVAHDGAGSPVALLPFGVEKHGPVRIAGFLGGADSNSNAGLFRPGVEFSPADLESLLRGVAAKSPAEIGAQCDIVFSCVPTVEAMNEVVDGEFQKFSVESGAYIREHFFGPDPRLRKMVEHLSDDDLRNSKDEPHRERLDRGESLPQHMKDHPVYYAGLAKTPPGMPTGSFGPTTAGRMDSYVAEFQAANQGVGFYIALNGQTLNTARVFIGLLLLGLWGIFVLVPAVRAFQVWLPDGLRHVPIFAGPPLGVGMLSATLMKPAQRPPTATYITVCPWSRNASAVSPRPKSNGGMALGIMCLPG